MQLLSHMVVACVDILEAAILFLGGLTVCISTSSMSDPGVIMLALLIGV